MVEVAKYPQLKAIAWNLGDDAIVSEPEALALYERNWRHVDQEAMPQEEREFLNRLVLNYGNGVLHV